MPAISVIVPIYNSQSYLKECVESVLTQSFSDWELILVDDGSTDSSNEICQNFASIDQRIRVITKPNGGLSSARNAGLD
ncbi:MAG: glycosyltransferase, partial [Muribaculaceae bacterium]|nr:glycosyltransferase [Muribaculaceae bacterium]